MTSSDATALSPDAVDEVARRVGTSHVGSVASEARVALVCSKFNGGITERLLEGALAGLEASGVKATTVTVAWVPGAFELPLAAMRLAESGTVDAVVALGAVIRGETAHFDFVAGECASACVYAFMGAVRRVAPPVSKLALHKMSVTLSGEGADTGVYRRFADPQMVALLSHYASRMGVSPDLVRTAEGLLPDHILILSSKAIARWRLAVPRL